MKLLVGVKRVIDYAVKIRVNASKDGVELQNVKMSMNPFCEIAVEEALRLKTKHPALIKEIIVVSIGPKQATETIRTALAMGCDRGIHIVSPDNQRLDSQIQSLTVAKLLHKVVETESPELILVGKQAIDSDAGCTGSMLAGLCNYPQGTFASDLDLDETTKALLVTRETDTGMETLRMVLPAVVTADLRLNEPRYATLPNIMKAKKKKIDTLEATDLLADDLEGLSPTFEVLEVNNPPERKAGIKVASVDELLDKLKNEAGVI